jgi:tetratricopeptide (TPR) repeat protein/Zn-dependent protease
VDMLEAQVPILVILGWLLGRFWHELGHTIAVYFAVRPAVRQFLRINFNPFYYSDWLQTWAVPGIMLLMAQMPLPGKTLAVRSTYLRTPRSASWIAAAGPIATLLLIIGLSLLNAVWPAAGLVREVLRSWLLFETIAWQLSLLPLPGLDGYAIVAPWLPQKVQRTLNPWQEHGAWIWLPLLVPYAIQRSVLMITRVEAWDAGVPFRWFLIIAVAGWLTVRKLRQHPRAGLLLDVDRPTESDASVDEPPQTDRTARWEHDLAVISATIADNPAKTSPYLWLRQANMLERLGRQNEILAVYDRALQYQPTSAVLWRERGLFLAEQQQFDQALENYTRSRDLNPSDADNLHYQGDALLELRDYETAIASYDRVLEKSPDFSHIWADRGYALFQLGQYPAARQSLEKALSLRRNDSYAWYWQARTLQSMNDLTNAVIAAKTGLAYDSKGQGLAGLTVDLLEQLREYDQALEIFDQFLASRQDAWRVAISRASILIQAGRFSEALTQLRSIDSPQELPRLCLRSRLLYQAGDYELALVDAELALAQMPQSIVALELKGQSLAALQREEAAIAVYQELLELRPEMFWVRVNLGLLYSYRQQYEAAQATYAMVLDQRPEDVDVLYLQVLMMLQLEQNDAAKQMLDRLLTINPNHELAQRIAQSWN